MLTASAVLVYSRSWFHGARRKRAASERSLRGRRIMRDKSLPVRLDKRPACQVRMQRSSSTSRRLLGHWLDFFFCSRLCLYSLKSQSCCDSCSVREWWSCSCLEPLAASRFRMTNNRWSIKQKTVKRLKGQKPRFATAFSPAEAPPAPSCNAPSTARRNREICQLLRLGGGRADPAGASNCRSENQLEKRRA